MNDKQPRMIPNPRYCDKCDGRGYVIYDAEWEPYAVQCDACKDRREQQTTSRRTDSMSKNHTEHNETVERLVQPALDVLHHDARDGDYIDKYERHMLRTKFGAILGKRKQAHTRPMQGD